MALTQQDNTARAVLREYRMSATKARQVLAVIRNRSAMDAIRELSLVNREAAEVIGKLLASAVANASVRYGLSAGELYVKEAFADEGATLKRFRPRARGRAGRIRKRSCHITIVVAEMPTEMLRRQALKAGGRSSNRRAERVASSRRSQDTQVALSPQEAPTETPVVDSPVLEVSEQAPVVEATAIEKDPAAQTVVQQAGADEGQKAVTAKGSEETTDSDEEK